MKTKWSHTRRVLALSVTGIMAVIPLVACSSQSPDSGSTGTTTIKFSYLWGGPEAQALEKIIADYNKSQDQVKVVGVSSPDFQKQLTSMSSSNGSFDISDNFGDVVGSWASKGILAPLDSYNIDTSDFVDSELTQMKHEGKTYALPIAIHSQLLMYNKKIFADAGLQPPTTTDELAAAAVALTKTDDSGNITQLGLGEAAPGATERMIAAVFGGSWWDKNGKPTPTAAKNIEAMTWYQDLVNKIGPDKIAKFVAGYGQYLSDQDPFYSGKLAMRIDGEWNGVSVPKVAPSLEWGVTTIPAASPEYKNPTEVTSSTLFIPANSKHKEAAAKFLAYMVGPKAMKDFTVALGNMPALKSLLNDSADYSNIQYFSDFADVLKSPNAYSPSSAPSAGEYSADLNKAFDSIASGKTTPAKALEQVQSRVSSYAK